jgi:hypothetical protein
MTPQQAVQQMIELVNVCEKELFYGSFSESTVKGDLAYRKEKRGFYIEQFTKWEESMDMVLGLIDGNPTAGELISKAKKNKSQAQKMLSYVRNA